MWDAWDMSNSGPGGRDGAVTPHAQVSKAVLDVVVSALRDGTPAQREAAAELLESSIPRAWYSTFATEE